MDERIPKDARVYLVAYAVVAATVFLALGGAYLNVYRYDPWFTPRFTPEMLLYRRFRDVLWWWPVVGVYLGGFLLLTEPRLRKSRLLWGGLVLFAASLYCLFSARGAA